MSRVLCPADPGRDEGLREVAALSANDLQLFLAFINPQPVEPGLVEAASNLAFDGLVRLAGPLDQLEQCSQRPFVVGAETLLPSQP
jgi:hypothetical protein